MKFFSSQETLDSFCSHDKPFYSREPGPESVKEAGKINDLGAWLPNDWLTLHTLVESLQLPGTLVRPLGAMCFHL